MTRFSSELRIFNAPREKRDARAARRKNNRKKHGVRAALRDEPGVGEIFIYDEIDKFWGIGAKDVADALDSLGSIDTVHIRVNSMGGDVFDGLAIYNQLARYPARKIVDIDGAAVSIASVIAMVGDEINIADSGSMMIHDPWTVTIGNSIEHRAMADLLEKTGDAIRTVYSKQVNVSQSDLKDMMAADTWMNADEALEFGFVDNIVDPVAGVEAAFDRSMLVNGRYDYHQIAASDGKPFDERHLERALSVLVDLGFEAKSEPPVPAPPSPDTLKEYAMNEELRALCVKAGMDAKLEDKEAFDWLTENQDKVFQAQAPQPAPVPQPVAQPAPAAPAITPDTLSQAIAAGVKEVLDANSREEQAKREQIRSLTDTLMDVQFGDDHPQALKDKCYKCETPEQVKALLIEARSNYRDTAGLSIQYGSEQPRDEFQKQAGIALAMRSLQASGHANKADKYAPGHSSSDKWQSFSNMPLVELCRECLMADGHTYASLRGLSREQVALAALGFPEKAGLRAEAAYHTTGSFSVITADAVNKSLLAGYEEAPQTWRGPGRQAASVPDFKTIHRIKLGAIPNLPDWPDNTNPEPVSTADEEETYAVEARSAEISFSWRLIVNDDMDAISRIPALMGDAAARTVNSKFWAQVTGNPTMGDGQALFLETPTGNRQRQNLTTGAGAPSVTTVGTLKNLMRQMRGVNTPEGNESEDILNLTPEFIIVPGALEQVTMELVRSGANPAANLSSAVFNTAGTLTPIVEPLLDADSTTAWYLFAAPSRVDTVEVTFLQGHETPQTNDFVDERNLSRTFLIYQTFAAKAIDHRGVQRHDGA